MKAKELAKLNTEELNNKLVELKKELIKLNAEIKTGSQLKSPGQARSIKKTIARIKTILKNKERNA